MSSAFRRLRAIERKLGKPSADDKRGLVIVDDEKARVHLFDCSKQNFTLIRRDDESAEQFKRRVARAAEEIPASVMSRAEYEETAVRLIREVSVMGEKEAQEEVARLLREADVN